MGRGLEIPYEVADKITLACLQDQLNYLRQEIRLHIEEGQYMHPEDYHESLTKLIPALCTIIHYFGGEV